MAPLEALTYSFLFGLLHGILPDEHTLPITFSYAIGGATSVLYQQEVVMLENF